MISSVFIWDTLVYWCLIFVYRRLSTLYADFSWSSCRSRWTSLSWSMSEGVITCSSTVSSCSSISSSCNSWIEAPLSGVYWISFRLLSPMVGRASRSSAAFLSTFILWRLFSFLGAYASGTLTKKWASTCGVELVVLVGMIGRSNLLLSREPSYFALLSFSIVPPIDYYSLDAVLSYSNVWLF